MASEGAVAGRRARVEARSIRLGPLIGRALSHVVLTLGAALMVVPFLWML